MKKISIILSIFMISMMFISCGSSNIKNNTNNIKEVIDNEKNEQESLSKDEMIAIARDLFDDYINQNRTDWYFVKAKGLKRQPVICLTDYRINDISFVKEENNKFTVDISYDIQYTDESNYWVAGNGELSENNWVMNKCNFVDIIKADNKYFLSNVYTG